MHETVSTLKPVDWLAARLGITLARAYDLCRSGGVPCVRIGRQVRVDPEALEAWIQAGGQALPGGWKAAP